MVQFLVLSLPRSRSKWLSQFLAAEGRTVGHDLLVACGSLRELEERFSLVDGSCETGAVVGWRLLRERLPDCRIATVHRPVEEIIDSISRKGFLVDRALLEERAAMLDELAWQEGVECFDYDELQFEQSLRELWSFCLPSVEWSHERWLRYKDQNLQIDFAERMWELGRNQEALAQLTQEVRLATRRLSCLN